MIVNIYSKNGCPSCTQAKALMEAKGIKYNYLTLGSDYDLSKFMSFNKAHKTFPLITQVTESNGRQGEAYIGGLKDLEKLVA